MTESRVVTCEHHGSRLSDASLFVPLLSQWRRGLPPVLDGQVQGRRLTLNVELRRIEVAGHMAVRNIALPEIQILWARRALCLPKRITMSDQEFETFREFVILDFLPFLKTPILQNLPDHL
jgi:hypothetical protein